MAKKKRQRMQAGSRGDAAQSMGLDHGSPSLVAMDSPDDPQLGAPAGQVSGNRARTSGREGGR